MFGGFYGLAFRVQGLGLGYGFWAWGSYSHFSMVRFTSYALKWTLDCKASPVDGSREACSRNSRFLKCPNIEMEAASLAMVIRNDNCYCSCHFYI